MWDSLYCTGVRSVFIHQIATTTTLFWNTRMFSLHSPSSTTTFSMDWGQLGTFHLFRENFSQNWWRVLWILRTLNKMKVFKENKEWSKIFFHWRGFICLISERRLDFVWMKRGKVSVNDVKRFKMNHWMVRPQLILNVLTLKFTDFNNPTTTTTTTTHFSFSMNHSYYYYFNYFFSLLNGCNNWVLYKNQISHLLFFLTIHWIYTSFVEIKVSSIFKAPTGDSDQRVVFCFWLSFNNNRSD
jgi:hypothetical protein